MFGDPPPNPLRSALRVVLLWLDSRLRSPRDRVGEVLTAAGGQEFTVYRETRVTPADRDSTDGSAVLVFRFHLRFTPAPVVPYAIRVFEPLSVLTTSFLAGLPGFRTKLWLFDHDTGDYQGVYEWATARDAGRYAEALTRLMETLPIPGSVSYEVHEETTLEEYVDAHSPDAGDGEGSPTGHGIGRIAMIGAVVWSLGTVYWLVVRPWFLGWGATDAELTRDLPGHDLVPADAVTSTQAVTVDAPPEAVWPWLVQIGQGRGGFYSYDWLEQLVGADIHNVDRIVPEYQSLEAGDEVLLAPKDYPLGSPDSWPVVADLEVERYLVLRPPTNPPGYVWTFYLDPVEESRTRLVARMSSPRRPTVWGRFVEGITWEPAHFLMQRKMLLGIGRLAEEYAGTDAS